MRIVFKNERGTIRFGQEYTFRITDIDGLGLVARTRNMTNFSGVDGQYCLGEYTGARVITISGDFIDEGNFWEKKAIRIFHADGVLSIGSRAINVVCSEFEVTKKGGGYKKFVLQFVADYPYFQDGVQKKAAVLSVNKLIKTKFRFPLIMSKRDCKTVIYNYGDTICEPIIEITAVGESAGGVITIRNLSCGKKICIEYTMQKGEKITADIEKRTLVSSINGSVLYALTDDSFLSDFMMDIGENEIAVTNESGGEIAVNCRYRNRYAEAV